jgi:hypothetical protein
MPERQTAPLELGLGRYAGRGAKVSAVLRNSGSAPSTSSIWSA